MKTPPNCELFSAGGRNYSLHDLILAAKLWGDWADLAREVRQGIACLQRMEEEGEELDEVEVESVANDFRYRRNLITTEETEAWLDEWALSVEDWTEYIRRAIVRDRMTGQLDQGTTGDVEDEEELELIVYAELVCSDHLARLSEKLAIHVAAYHWARQEELVEGSAERAPSDGVEQTLPHLEKAYEAWRRNAVTPEGIRNQVKGRQLDWIRLDCRYVLFPSEDAVREARLCIREDGMSPEQVAEVAATEVHADSLCLDQVHPDQWNLFLAAQKGDLVGPVRWNDEFALFILQDKSLPSADDPEIRRRAEEALLIAVTSQEIAKRVTWSKRF